MSERVKPPLGFDIFQSAGGEVRLRLPSADKIERLADEGEIDEWFLEYLRLLTGLMEDGRDRGLVSVQREGGRWIYSLTEDGLAFFNG